jgi:hypothetical protein
MKDNKNFLVLLVLLQLAILSEGATESTSHQLRRGLKKVSFDIPDLDFLPEDTDYDWVIVIAAVVVLWLVLTCLCNTFRALCCCRSSSSSRYRRTEYTTLPATANRGMPYYDGTRPPAYNPNYQSPSRTIVYQQQTLPPTQRKGNTCGNILLAACCFECCCRDNRDVDCCDLCCCLCVYQMCCKE